MDQPAAPWPQDIEDAFGQEFVRRRKQQRPHLLLIEGGKAAGAVTEDTIEPRIGSNSIYKESVARVARVRPEVE
jgi:hypothetical protein